MRTVRRLRLGYGSRPDSYPHEKPHSAGIDFLGPNGEVGSFEFNGADWDVSVNGSPTGTIPGGGGGSSTVPILFGVGPNPLGVNIGTKRYMKLVANYTLTAWALAGDVAGDAVIDIWANATFPPTIADSITAAAPPTLSSQIENSGGVTGWTVSLTAGTWLAFHVLSASTVQRLDLTLTATKS